MPSAETPTAETESTVAATALHAELPYINRPNPRAYGVGRYGASKYSESDPTRYSWARVLPAITSFLLAVVLLASPAAAINSECEAADTLTSVYGFCKPDVDAEGANFWGDKLNENFDQIETALQGIDVSSNSAFISALSVSTASLASTKVAKAGDTMTGQLTLYRSSLTVTGGGGVGITYGISATTGVFSSSLSATALGVTYGVAASSIMLSYGSPGSPAIGFSTDSRLDLYHGPYGWVVEGSSSSVAFPGNSQIWLHAQTTRIGNGANLGNHGNTLLGIGGNSINDTDLTDTGGTSSNNFWGTWIFPTVGISTVYHNSLFNHGLAVSANIKSVDGSANAASTTRVLRIVAPLTDGTATSGATYGIYIDSITANLMSGNPTSSGTAGVGIYNLSNYYAPSNDTYIALGNGAFGYTIPGRAINLTNNTAIWQAGNGGATAYHLLGATNSDSMIVGDPIQNSIQLDNNFVYFGRGASQATMTRGTLTVPYGVSATTGVFSGAVNVSGALTTTVNGGGVFTNSSPYWGVMNAAGTTGLRFSDTQLLPFSASVQGTALTLNGGVGGNIGVGTTVTPSTLTVSGSAQFGSGATISTITSSGFFIPRSMTLAQIQAYTPLASEVGGIIGCSNCTTETICRSTGTTVQGFCGASGRSNPCQ